MHLQLGTERVPRGDQRAVGLWDLPEPTSGVRARLRMRHGRFVSLSIAADGAQAIRCSPPINSHRSRRAMVALLLGH